MRTIDGVWAGGDLADEDLKRMADAAERIVGRERSVRRSKPRQLSG